ncbi:DUF4260 family protein [Micromonospora ureilytica]|uniref:DUF4260 family protein n=1 Tax=Micromonospora ureilytica TaxID=709868 RepID=UPI001F0C0646|nr:DUF4260 family protein [Micromonospora ureilytica]
MGDARSEPWAFHIAVDRALGYGLKTTEGFEHTHLGRMGKARHAGTRQRSLFAHGLVVLC